MASKIPQIYTNRTRVRVCGLCWQNESLLMVNHRELTSGNFWSPPGGGIDFGESAEDALVREFQEETGVRIFPSRFQFVCEYIQQPLHAIELFFQVDYLGGEARKGHDPESPAERQLITEVKFMHWDEILALPSNERHGIFRVAQSAADIKSLTGFYRI